MIAATVSRSTDGTSATINWERQSDLSAYEVFRRVAGGVTWSRIATRSSAYSSHTATGLDPKAAYEFMVRGREESPALAAGVPIPVQFDAEDTRFVNALNAVDIFPDRSVDIRLMALAEKRAHEIVTAPGHRPLVELAPATDFGEVLAWNSWWADPVQGFIKSWAVNSATHRALMSDPDYKYIGAAWVRYGEAQAAACAIVKVTPA